MFLPISVGILFWCFCPWATNFTTHATLDSGVNECVVGKNQWVQMKWNESGFRPPLCTYRLNWARRTSWGWWDDWDDTVLQTQDSKFEPWRSEAEHATSRSRRLPTILTFTRGWGRNNFCFFQTAETGNRTPDSGVKGSGANHYPRAPAHQWVQWIQCAEISAVCTRMNMPSNEEVKCKVSWYVFRLDIRLSTCTFTFLFFLYFKVSFFNVFWCVLWYTYIALAMLLKLYVRSNIYFERCKRSTVHSTDSQFVEECSFITLLILISVTEMYTVVLP